MTKNKLTQALIPDHKKLSDVETKKVLENYKIKKRQLPKISLSDPVLKGMDVEKGDVIEITRKSQTAGTAMYYRMVY